MDLLVVRHAQSTWNAQHRWAGQRNPGLSAHGRTAACARAAVLAALHPPIGAVATSDLRRAHQTAQLLTHTLGLSPPARVPGLRERHAGQWTGCTSRQIEARFPGELGRWRRGEIVNPPGSESWEAFTGRVLAALGHLATAPTADRIVVVAHQGVLRAIEHHFGVPPRPAADLDGMWLRAEHQTVDWLTHWAPFR
jgi:broad specificity phosphatase PhoE